MNPLTTPQPHAETVDGDLAQQANAGHGIPSQDPTAAAQTPLDTQEAEREGRSVLVGGVMVAGAATGAAIGVAVAGPVGILAGATLGAVAGALGGAAAGATASPDTANSDGTPPADPTRVPAEVYGDDGRPVVRRRD